MMWKEQWEARRAFAAVAVAVTAAAAVPALGATLRYDNNAGDGLWETPDNWVDSSTTPSTRHVPGTADVADISGPLTASLSSTQTVTEVQVGVPTSTSTTAAGTSTLNILPGTNLTISSGTGARIGRALAAGQAVGSSTGRVVQSGGAVNIAASANGYRLSAADSGAVADSYYEISGGSVTGVSPTNVGIADLRIGATGNTWGTAEFYVKGSGATSIHFADLQMAGSVAGTSGTSLLHFGIDSGGVTPITIDDELQFRGTGAGMGQNLLQIDLLAEAPQSDITLVNADRLNTNGVTNAQDLERFTGMPDETSIVRTFGGSTYTWTLKYTDGSDDGVLDASVKLLFVSRTAVPEPAGVWLLGVGALALLRRKRWDVRRPPLGG